MKGKINKEGILEIWRKSRFKKAMCRPAGIAIDAYGLAEERYCDDDCALFKEPKDVSSKNAPKWKLKLCQKRVWKFDEFTDERE